MDREEDVRLLRGGKYGIAEWNRSREDVIAELNRCLKDGGAWPSPEADLSETDFSNTDLRGAQLTWANLRRANLNKAILSEVDLYQANLSEANLSEANLSEADLFEANLGEANLTKANLRRAELGGASFIHADLTLADLSGANLYYTNFSEAHLHEAILADAQCGTTVFSCDLSEVVALDKIEHSGPSTISVAAMLSFKGALPERFLRGCGIEIEDIHYFRGRTSPRKYHSCFISYSHSDMAFARRICDALQAENIPCWLDEHQIRAGDNIYRKVDQGIREWDKVLLCASKHSLTSGWVDDEIKHAFAKEKKLFKKRNKEVLALIPLNLDGYLFDGWEHPKKNLVLERLAINFRNWQKNKPKFEAAVDQVVKALRADDGAREKPPKPLL